jgi:hypothetical protein
MGEEKLYKSGIRGTFHFWSRDTIRITHQSMFPKFDVPSKTRAFTSIPFTPRLSNPSAASNAKGHSCTFRRHKENFALTTTYLKKLTFKRT